MLNRSMHVICGYNHCTMNSVNPAYSNVQLSHNVMHPVGFCSGAHVNTAVTIAVTLSGGLKWVMAPLYIAAQLVGSLCGAALAWVSLRSLVYLKSCVLSRARDCTA